MKKTLQEQKNRIIKLMEQGIGDFGGPESKTNTQKYYDTLKDIEDSGYNQEESSNPFDKVMTDFKNRVEPIIDDTFNKLSNDPHNQTYTDEAIKNQMLEELKTILLDIYNNRPGGVYNSSLRYRDTGGTEGG